MALATCDISGTLVGPNGTGIEDVEVRGFATSPFIVGTDWVGTNIISTTTDSNGDFTITLPQTTAANRTMVISLRFPDGEQGRKVQDYTVTVPDAATANFEDLITTP